MGHTPGPWRVSEATRTPDGNPCFHYIEADASIVASTWAGPNIENACLIAAAPDLLAALESLLPYVKGSESFAAQYADAIAAIAKARRGEA